MWLVAPLLVITVVFLAFILLPTNPPLRYEFTEGYRGWVVIQYGDQRCPSLPIQNEHLVLKVPASGCLCTASALPEGRRKNEFQYVNSDGRHTAIPHAYGDPSSQILEHVTGKKIFVREYFFVGPLQEYREAIKLPDVDRLKCQELN